MVAVNDEIREALSRLDGSRGSVVSVVTGLTVERLAELGGVPEHG